MKHIFIVNPVAGKAQANERLVPKIKSAAKEMNIDYEIFITEGVNSAKDYANKSCKNGEFVRLYACGGDGTLNEVANGAFGYENAEIAVIPCGTGNDFIKNFSDNQNFTDIKCNIKGSSQKIDLIKYGDRYAVNFCNIGLDAKVASKMAKFKYLPFVTGEMAYTLALAYVFFSKMGVPLKVKLDNYEIAEGEYLLAAIAGGCFYGGGYCATPLAKIDDGLIDVCMVKKLSRFRILSFFEIYKSGKHLESVKMKPYIIYKKCRRVSILSKNDILLCVDGEIQSATNVDFEVVPLAISFCVPEGCTSL